MIVSGGLNDASEPLSSVEAIDLETFMPCQVPDIPQGQYRHIMATLEESPVLCGGFYGVGYAIFTKH